VSVFTVSIPRGGDGRVRIIPIQRRGYSLFSPAPINALTISAFNHIRAEEHPKAPDWLGTGLCYAALAGAHPQAAEVERMPKPEIPSCRARLAVGTDSGPWRRHHFVYGCLGRSRSHGVDHDLQSQGKAAEGHAFARGELEGQLPFRTRVRLSRKHDRSPS
jgi:hypothetical protein